MFRTVITIALNKYIVHFIGGLERTPEEIKKTRKRRNCREQKKWFDFSDLASLIIRARFDRCMHYSVTFRRPLCIAFVDVQATTFVGKPVRLAEKWSEFARTRLPQNGSLWRLYRPHMGPSL